MNMSVASMSLLFSAAASSAVAAEACHDMLDFNATKLRSSQQVDFCDAFAGKALLLVNTASQCGFTPQFKDLEKLHKRYGDRLAIVGFPSDDFNQEYADSAKVADVCYVNYGVTFTMLEPSQVKGEGANTLFKTLAERTGKQPQWNFNKYLVSADGATVKYFPSSAKPSSDEFRAEVEKVLEGG